MDSLEAIDGNYEALAHALSEMQPAQSGDQRHVHWAGTNEVIGLARDSQGRIEIFIVGPQLACESTVVAGNLSYESWQRADHDVMQANRLRLPAAPHFDAIAAFLSTHLLDSGADHNPQLAFTRSEPVIEMAFERLRLQGEALVGLSGELLLLRALLRQRTERTEEILAGWEGYGRSARDFRLGSLGVEVKTTRGPVSQHRIQGVHQVDRGHGRDGQEESALLLVSIGIEECDDDSGGNCWNLPSLVEGVVTQIKAAAPDDAESLVRAFLGHVQEYGSGRGAGYDHSEMRHRIIYGLRHRTTFVRAYDMLDPAVAVLRGPDLVQYPIVVADSVEFSIHLPSVITGDINPVTGIDSATSRIASDAWG